MGLAGVGRLTLARVRRRACQPRGRERGLTRFR